MQKKYCLAVLCFVFSTHIQAAMGLISLEALSSNSELVVRGTIRAVEILAAPPSRSDQLRQEYVPTLSAQLEIADVIKGRFESTVLRILFSSMEDSPNFRPSEHVIVFLKRTSNPTIFTTLGQKQGKFLISADGLVKRNNTKLDEFQSQLDDLLKSKK